MQPSIPSARSVELAFQSVAKRLGTVRKRINASATKELKANLYELAEKWMEVGRSVADFTQRLDAFVDEWKRLVKTTRIVAKAQYGTEIKPAGAGKPKRTPTWKFCEPALRAVSARGGSASLSDLLEDLVQDTSLELTDVDRASSSARGTPLWHRSVKQAYRQCQREGWIEKRRDGLWKIISKGTAVVSGAKDRSHSTAGGER